MLSLFEPRSPNTVCSKIRVHFTFPGRNAPRAAARAYARSVQRGDLGDPVQGEILSSKTLNIPTRRAWNRRPTARRGAAVLDVKAPALPRLNACRPRSLKLARQFIGAP